MTDSKLVSMSEAVAEHVPEGASVLLGAGLEALIPFSAGHEILRQNRRNLTLIAPISDALIDQLVGAGVAQKVIAAWVGNVSEGLGHNFRRAVEESVPSPLEVLDHTNLTIALALHAAALGVSYLPTCTTLGTDILAGHPDLKEIHCPFTGHPMVAVRALAPDVAILPVQRADEDGNAHLWGNLGVIPDAARAAKAVIVVAEEIVPARTIASDPNRTVIPGFLVASVVHEPFACHPSPCLGYYGRDHAFFSEYHQRSRTREGFVRWLEEWVHGVDGREEYIKRLGPERVERLRVQKHAYSAPADFGY